MSASIIEQQHALIQEQSVRIKALELALARFDSSAKPAEEPAAGAAHGGGAAGEEADAIRCVHCDDGLRVGKRYDDKLVDAVMTELTDCGALAVSEEMAHFAVRRAIFQTTADADSEWNCSCATPECCASSCETSQIYQQWIKSAPCYLHPLHEFKKALKHKAE
jgi:hypothetical protein